MAQNENLSTQGSDGFIRCRYCGQRNQTRTDNGEPRCGRCRMPLSDKPHKKFPDLHAKLQIACTTLGVDMPDLFVQQNPVANAFTGGVERPVIVLYSQLIERLTDEEVLAVVAHEVGHIHAEHVLYLTAARLIEFLATTAVSVSPLATIVKELLTMTMRSALLAWARR